MRLVARGGLLVAPALLGARLAPIGGTFPASSNTGTLISIEERSHGHTVLALRGDVEERSFGFVPDHARTEGMVLGGALYPVAEVELNDLHLGPVTEESAVGLRFEPVCFDSLAVDTDAFPAELYARDGSITGCATGVHLQDASHTSHFLQRVRFTNNGADLDLP